MTQEKLDSINKNINANITFLINEKQRNFKQKYFRPYGIDVISQELGLTKQSLYDTINNKRVPSTNKILKVCEYFCIGIDKLVYGELCTDEDIVNLESLKAK